MNSLAEIRIRFYRNLPLFIGMCLSLYFSYHSLYGYRSYSNLVYLSFSLDNKVKTLKELEAASLRIKNKVIMMRPNTASADMFDEQVRFILGYKRKGEIIVMDN